MLENGKKTTIGLISKKTTLYVQHTFLYISLEYSHVITKLSGMVLCWCALCMPKISTITLFTAVNLIHSRKIKGSYKLILNLKIWRDNLLHCILSRILLLLLLLLLSSRSSFPNPVQVLICSRINSWFRV